MGGEVGERGREEGLEGERERTVWEGEGISGEKDMGRGGLVVVGMGGSWKRF